MEASCVKAVIFDLDGTLIDSAPDIHAAANKMLRGLGRSELSLDQIKRFVGNGVAKLVERALDATGGPDDRGLGMFAAAYAAAPAVLTRPYPGVMDLLEVLRAQEMPLGICTNKPEGLALSVLDGLNMGAAFAAVVGGDTLPVRKPDPAPLLHCARLLGVGVPDLLYVGDSETDAETATRAGARFALFSEGYRKSPVEEIAADQVFDSFAVLGETILTTAVTR